MLPQLHAIERQCSRIPGALKQIVLIDPDDLQELPDYYVLPNVAELLFKPGKTAFTFQHDRANGRLEDTQTTDNRAGDIFEYTLSCTIRNIRLDVDYLRAKLINRRIHVVATYQDGSQRFLPYMRLSSGSDSGESRSARNGYSFKGVARLHRPAVFIAAEITGGGDVPDTGTTPAVSPVSISTSASTYTYLVPAGKLVTAIWVKSDASQEVQVGTTSGGWEIGGPAAADAGDPIIFGSNLLRPETSTPIYFSGLAGNNTIEIWLLG